MDDSSLQLKDAVADSRVQTLFDKKSASQDLLSANVHGITALDRAASILQALLQSAAGNLPGTGQAETQRRFDTRAITPANSIPSCSPAIPACDKTNPCPSSEVAKDQRFQKLVVERDALDHQIQLRQKEWIPSNPLLITPRQRPVDQGL